MDSEANDVDGPMPFRGMVANTSTTSALHLLCATTMHLPMCLLCVWDGERTPSMDGNPASEFFKSNLHNLTTQALTFVNLPSQHGRYPENRSAAFDFKLVNMED
jgi:hypothetical protein